MLATASVLIVSMCYGDPGDFDRAIAEWRAWKDRYQIVTASIVKRRPDMPARRTEVAVSGELVRMVDDLRAPKAAEENRGNRRMDAAPQAAACMNQKYGFFLSRKSPDSDWIVGGRAWTPAAGFIREKTKGDWTQYLWAPFSIAEVPLCELFERPQCKVAPLKQHGDDINQMDLAFSYTPTSDEISAHAVSSFLRAGNIVIDKRLRFGIVHSQIQMAQNEVPVNVEFALHYDDTEFDGFPRLREIERTIPGNASRTISVDIEKLDFTAAPPESFTLTAFGLPEPENSIAERVASPTNRIYIYLGAAMIAIAIALHTYRRFKRAPAAG